jgi:hypothetical protein
MNSQAINVLGAPRGDIFATTDTIPSLQTLISAKLEHTERAQKAAENELRQCRRYEQSGTDKIRSLRTRLKRAEQGLREVKERKKVSMASEEEHNYRAQRYYSCQVDLERMAGMQEDMAKGLRLLNLDASSLEKALATAMVPTMEQFREDYFDILENGAHVKSGGSS